MGGLKMEIKPLRQPMYRKLQELLREAIESGEFPEGEQFPTERQVVERYQVSRPTANKVLSGMAAEGLLEFRKGVGTFVRRRPLDYDVRTLVSFTQKARDAGRHPSTQVLSFDRIAVTEVDAEIALRLRAKPGETLLAVGRLRLADGLPVILERRWLPAAMFPGLSRGELRGSIYRVIADKYRLEITESDQTIRAIGIRGADAKLLQVPAGSAGFLVSAAGYAGDRAVWWERTLYRGDSYEFHHHRAAPGRLISMPARPKAAGGAR
jgi:GntR family transcriptional regulator